MANAHVYEVGLFQFECWLFWVEIFFGFSQFRALHNNNTWKPWLGGFVLVKGILGCFFILIFIFDFSWSFQIIKLKNIWTIMIKVQQTRVDIHFYSCQEQFRKRNSSKNSNLKDEWLNELVIIWCNQTRYKNLDSRVPYSFSDVLFFRILKNLLQHQHSTIL